MCYSVLCTFYLRTNAKIAEKSLMNHHYYFLKLFGYSSIANFHRGRHLNSIGLDFCTGKSFCMLLSRMQLLRHEQVVKFSKFATGARSSISFLILPEKNSDPNLRPCSNGINQTHVSLLKYDTSKN